MSEDPKRAAMTFASCVILFGVQNCPAIVPCHKILQLFLVIEDEELISLLPSSVQNIETKMF